MVHIAIIGSGPSGCYVADILAKKIPDSQIDLFDKLPTPFGLVRAGVAPDHLHTKNITRQFERILSRENIRFAGNINLGTDISYAELKQHYHIIVIASGAPLDNKLNIEGESLNGVYGAGEISRWYNGHPEFAGLQIPYEAAPDNVSEFFRTGFGSNLSVNISAPSTETTSYNLSFARTNEEGYIPSNENMETSVPGVYSAGDIRVKDLRQIVTATGDGSIAAEQAQKFVEEINEKTKVAK